MHILLIIILIVLAHRIRWIGDFIIKSVDFALDKYFGKHLADENVHILDPFVGTGTFIAETLNYLATQMKAG
ncbi:hypothetical protein, partial [Oenococcus oeni]|uniref:hypothetical protein n=1 Tax=Oenococcus oeni TaxID=1247 RepID=UPI001C5B7685